MRTRDGVEISAFGKYWMIPCLQERDFSGLNKEKIPNRASFCATGDEIERRQPHTLVSGGRRYASTKELANQYAVEDFIERLDEQEKDRLQELKSLKAKREKIRLRLVCYLKSISSK